MLFFAWFFCQVKRNFVKTIFGRTKDTLLQENSWTDDKTLTSHIVIRSHPWLLQRNFCHASENELTELIQLVCTAHGLVWSDHKTQAWSSDLIQRHPRKARLLTLSWKYQHLYSKHKREIWTKGTIVFVDSFWRKGSAKSKSMGWRSMTFLYKWYQIMQYIQKNMPPVQGHFPSMNENEI